MTVEDDARGRARPRRAGGQQRIVGQHGADADEDGVHAAAQFVNFCPRGFVADPARIAAVCGQFAIERHSPFRVNIRTALLQQGQIGCIKPPPCCFADADVNGDARAAQQGDALPRDLGEWVRHGCDDASDAGLDHGIGAGRRLAVMATWLQRDV